MKKTKKLTRNQILAKKIIKEGLEEAGFNVYGGI